MRKDKIAGRAAVASRPGAAPTVDALDDTPAERPSEKANGRFELAEVRARPSDPDRSRRLRLYRISRRCSLALLLFALIACGSPVSPGGETTGEPPQAPPAAVPVQAIIGPNGGALASDDGSILLEVPAGALDSEVMIGVANDPAADHPWALAGSIYRFEPEGLEFMLPASLHVRYDPIFTEAPDPETGLAIHRLDGSDWIELPSVVDTATQTVTAEIDGFSRYALGGVAPRVTINVGLMGPVTLVPLARAEVRTNACVAGACGDIENESEDYPTEIIPLFQTGDDDCGFHIGQFAGFLEDYVPTEATGDGGAAYVGLTAQESGPRAWLEYELNSFAEPVYRTGHNTTGTVVSTLSFLSLDAWAPGERRLVVDIDNPGGVTFDLAVAWLLEGGVAGVLIPHVQASSQVALLGCGETWEQADHHELFNVVVAATPINPNPVLGEAGVMRLQGLSAPQLQLWVGLHVQTRARSAYGDDEGTVGYGHVGGGQAAATGSFAVVAEVPDP